MMNEERWILATLKRRLLKEKSNRNSDLFYAKEILAMIAEIEVEAVLGAPTEEEIEEVE